MPRAPIAVMTLIVIFTLLIVGCGQSGEPTGSDQGTVSVAKESGVPGEGKAFHIDVTGMTISDPSNEYVAARSLTEFLRSRINAALEVEVMPECHRIPEGASPNQYECYTEVPEEPGVRTWSIYSVSKRTGKVTEVAHGVLDPNEPDPVPAKNYAKPIP